ncbi:outer membrane protein OmpA-like peptidoglycan-associated protein [Rhizobium tibeticum]|nr:outer membrane protein OmpA-like peptidoglycan-associated protein [Rhizobium tibeticum]
MSKTLLYGATKVDKDNSAYSAIASLEQFQWRNRVLVVFADEKNARAARQENQLLANRDALQERDIVILKIAGSSVRVLFGAGEISMLRRLQAKWAIPPSESSRLFSWARTGR